MKRMLPLSLIAAAALLLLQAGTPARAVTTQAGSETSTCTQPVIVAWDRVGTPA